jgi:uncharacterized membrane protein YhaH (DUF805 family)
MALQQSSERQFGSHAWLTAMQNRDLNPGSPLYQHWNAEAEKHNGNPAVPSTQSNRAKELFRLCFGFVGRIGRGQYWAGLGLSKLMILTPIIVWLANKVDAQWSVALGLPIIVGYVVLFAILTKRLHDLDIAAWGLLGAVIAVLVPIAGVALIIWLGCAKGTAGENRFGPEPIRKGRGSSDYHSIIAHAVSELPTNTAAARQALYSHARTTLASQLSNNSTRLACERAALEKAIREVDAKAAVHRSRAGVGNGLVDFSWPSPLVLTGRVQAKKRALNMSTYWYVQNGERRGPVSDDDLHRLLINGTLTPSALVWKPGMETWQPATQVDALAPVLAHVRHQCRNYREARQPGHGFE